MVKIIERIPTNGVADRECSFSQDEDEMFSYSCDENGERVIIQFDFHPITGKSVLVCPGSNLGNEVVKIPPITKENKICEFYYKRMAEEEIKACIKKGKNYICFPARTGDKESVMYYYARLDEKPEILAQTVEIKSDSLGLHVIYVLTLGIWGVLGVIIGMYSSRKRNN